MDKRKLAKIAVAEASAKAIECAKNDKSKFVIEAQMYGEKKELLALYIYNKGKLLANDLKPEARMFLTNDDYITQDLKSQKRKWYTGTIYNVMQTLGYYLNFYSHDYNSACSLPQSSAMKIKKFFKIRDTESDPYTDVIRFQNKILEKRLEQKHLKETKPIDELMKTVPSIPSAFPKWVENEALYNSRYIFYQYMKKSTVTGYCTHCKNNVQLHKPTHNQEYICPNCKSKVILKSIGKSHHVIDKVDTLLLQKTKSGFLARYFTITKNYGNDFKNPSYYTSEYERDFYGENLSVDKYEYGMYKNQKIRWNKKDLYKYYYEINTVVYPHNIKKISPYIPYSGIDILVRHGHNFSFNFNSLLKDQSNNHIAEKFAKVGLYRMAQSYLNTRHWYRYGNVVKINEDGKTLNAILGLRNDDIKVIIAADANLEELTIFQKFRDKGKRLTLQQLNMLKKCEHYYNCVEEITEDVNFGKALKYLDSLKVKDKYILYRDYLHSCKVLHYDLKNDFVAYPKHLKARHDQNLVLIDEKRKEKEIITAKSNNIKIANRQKELNDYYGFSNEKYFIRAPYNADEIIAEGIALHHCVGSFNYINKMAAGLTNILFLRTTDNPDKPYYTIEIRDNEIIQCHSFANEDKDKYKIKGFIEKWQRFLSRKLEQQNLKNVG